MAGQTLYTLDALAEQVIRLMKGGRPTSDIHIDRREISRQMRAIASELIRGRWFEMKNTGEINELGHIYLATFNGVEVKEDEDTDEFYIDLPAIPENLPDGTGIQNIQPETKTPEKNVPMIPIPMNANIILSQLPVGALENHFGFMWRRTRAYFTEQNGRTVGQEKIEKVMVQMITVGPEDVDDYSPFPIPSDLIPMLLTRTLTIFGIEVAPDNIDLINDNK